MKNLIPERSTYERTVFNLCEEVDFWREAAEKWKAMYEQEVAERNEELTSRLRESEKGIATAMMFALSVREQPDGSLSLDKDGRALVAATMK